MKPAIKQRDDARTLVIGPVSIRFVLTASDTAGTLEAFEFTGPAGSPGPAPHTHAKATETFFVLEGMLVLHANGVTTPIHAGGVASVPPNIPHRFEYPGPGPTRFLSVLTPAIHFDRYFSDLKELFTQGWPPAPEKMAALFVKYDIQPA